MSWRREAWVEVPTKFGPTRAIATLIVEWKPGDEEGEGIYDDMQWEAVAGRLIQDHEGFARHLLVEELIRHDMVQWGEWERVEP